MTPLALSIARQLATPIKDRDFQDKTGILRRMDDLHCFEVTEVWPLMEQIRQSGFGAGHFDNKIGFAPAPRFWIEYRSTDGLRWAWHAEQHNQGDPQGWVTFRLCGMMQSGTAAELGEPFDIRLSDFAAKLPKGNEYPNYVGMIYAALVIINSPRIVGRKQHMPHRGLERRMANAKAMIGKFPLRAWTEIKIKVSDIGKRADGSIQEAHYTGERCLHFCRAHLRVRLGRLEIVKAHERGNPALGIKRTRYRLAA